MGFDCAPTACSPGQCDLCADEGACDTVWECGWDATGGVCETTCGWDDCSSCGNADECMAATCDWQMQNNAHGCGTPWNGFCSQFTAMETAIDEMNSLRDYLKNQLESLPLTNKNK